jgi:hypothetical protein
MVTIFRFSKDFGHHERSMVTIFPFTFSKRSL